MIAYKILHSNSFQKIMKCLGVCLCFGYIFIAINYGKFNFVFSFLINVVAKLTRIKEKYPLNFLQDEKSIKMGSYIKINLEKILLLIYSSLF